MVDDTHIRGFSVQLLRAFAKGAWPMGAEQVGQLATDAANCIESLTTQLHEQNTLMSHLGLIEAQKVHNALKTRLAAIEKAIRQADESIRIGEGIELTYYMEDFGADFRESTTLLKSILSENGSAGRNEMRGEQ